MGFSSTKSAQCRTEGLAQGITSKSNNAADAVPDLDGNVMVSLMRVALAISVLFAAIVEYSNAAEVSLLTWVVVSGYAAHSVIVFVVACLREKQTEDWLNNWTDVCWHALIVFVTGGVDSVFSLLFFFPILTASFHFGFERGAQMTIASATLFVASAMLSNAALALPQLLMRTAFLLVLGYMSAYWGEAKVVSKRRLALLRDVTRASNPRFGVDHTLASFLEKTREFFKGDSCLLVMHDKESDTYFLRTAKMQDTMALAAERVRPELAEPLMSFPQEHAVLHASPSCSLLDAGGTFMVYDSTREAWIKQNEQLDERLAGMLEAHSFMCAPLSSYRWEGRIYVLSSRQKFRKADVLFLSHILAQVLPVIESIELLDHLASDAAVEERKKLAWNLHDTTIQPYIGLQLGLSALRHKAASDNPLVEDIDRLAAMTDQVIGDLRHYADSLKSRAGESGPMLFAALKRKVAQAKEFYGIEIDLSMEGTWRAPDRLAAEVFQLVSEGLSNICKHSAAQQGSISVCCEQQWLKIKVQNEGTGGKCPMFTPRSLTERAAALGGSVRVLQGADGGAIVHIDIPI